MMEKEHNLLRFDALRRIIGKELKKIPDPRPGKSQISLHDALMSAFAMFCLAVRIVALRGFGLPKSCRKASGVYGVTTQK